VGLDVSGTLGTDIGYFIETGAFENNKPHVVACCACSYVMQSMRLNVAASIGHWGERYAPYLVCSVQCAVCKADADNCISDGSLTLFQCNDAFPPRKICVNGCNWEIMVRIIERHILGSNSIPTDLLCLCVCGWGGPASFRGFMRPAGWNRLRHYTTGVFYPSIIL